MITLNSAAFETRYFEKWAPVDLFLFCDPIESFDLIHTAMSSECRNLLQSHLELGWTGWFIGNESPMEYLASRYHTAQMANRVSTNTVSIAPLDRSDDAPYWWVSGRVMLFDDVGFCKEFRENLEDIPQRVHVAAKDHIQSTPDLQHLLSPLNAYIQPACTVDRVTFQDTPYADQIKIICALLFSGFPS